MARAKYKPGGYNTPSRMTAPKPTQYRAQTNPKHSTPRYQPRNVQPRIDVEWPPPETDDPLQRFKGEVLLPSFFMSNPSRDFKKSQMNKKYAGLLQRKQQVASGERQYLYDRDELHPGSLERLWKTYAEGFNYPLQQKRYYEWLRRQAGSARTGNFSGHAEAQPKARRDVVTPWLRWLWNKLWEVPEKRR